MVYRADICSVQNLAFYLYCKARLTLQTRLVSVLSRSVRLTNDICGIDKF